jgi:hypothetical protein
MHKQYPSERCLRKIADRDADAGHDFAHLSISAANIPFLEELMQLHLAVLETVKTIIASERSSEPGTN